MKKGLFITVNYRQAAMTIGMLKNLLHIHGVEQFRVMVVDNTESDDDVAMLWDFLKTSNSSFVEVLKSPVNLGYFGAVNFALKKINGINDYDYLVVSNNDIEIKDSHFFQKLLAMESEAQVLAPDIISRVTGKHQNPHRVSAVSKFQKIQYRLLYINYYLGLLLHYSRKLVKSITASKARLSKPVKQRIFSAHGAFLIFDRSYFEKGGHIDDGYFLFGEEDSVAAQCADKDMKILFCPDLKVYHNEHISTEGSGFKKRTYHLQQNAYRYIKTNFPNFY